MEAEAPPPPPPVPRPVLELNYASLSQRRPGIVTAVGVISVVLGTLGFVTGAWGVISAGAMWFLAVAGPAMNAAAASAMASGPFSPAEIQAVIGVMEASVPIPDEREQMLGAFLNEQGSSIFSSSPRPLKSQAIASRITDGMTDQSGAVRFTLTDSTLDVGPGYVIWAPGTAISPATPRSDQVEAAVQAIGRVASAPASPQQYAVVRQALSRSQPFIRPGAADAGKQIVGAIVRQQSMTVFADNGALLYVPNAPAGRTAWSEADGEVIVHSTTVVIGSPSPATAPTTLPAIGVPKVSATPAAVATFAALGSFLLAIFLLVIGIMVFRLSRRARRLHLFYAAAKIVLVIVGAMAWWWIMRDMVSGSGALSMGMLWYSGVWSAALPLVYPLALLIVMNSRGVKEYYARLD